MKLTLDRKAIYRIKVPGEVRKLQLGIGEIKIKYKQIGADGHMITILTSVFDQAGLNGFLRRLYAMGLSLIMRDTAISLILKHITLTIASYTACNLIVSFFRSILQPKRFVNK